MNNGENNLLSQIVTTGAAYVWFVVLAAWGGTVNYIRRVKKNETKFNVYELVGEWSISAFAGVVTALICQEMNISQLMTYALVAISGHLGGRSIDTFEAMFSSKFKKPD
jgi:tellurite resistance protein TehA-like permease